MFYPQPLLSRNGPLGNIWMAAYCFNKLKKDQIAATDISSSIDKLFPDIHISYRVLAQLLLGIVRIFSKQVDFLYHDCSEVLATIRKSFIPGQLNVPRKLVGALHDRLTKGTNHSQKHSATVLKEASLPTLADVIRARCQDVSFTLPESFELDSFDLDVQEERDAPKSNEESSMKDVWADKRSPPYSPNQCYPGEVAAWFEFDSACFTPMADVLSSDMMDIHREVTEIYKSSNSEAGGEHFEGYSHHLEECWNRESSGAKKSLAPILLDKDRGNQENSNNLQEAMSQNFLKDLYVDKPESQVEQVNSYEPIATEYDKGFVFEDGQSEDITPNKTHNKSEPICDPGIFSPKFAVATPAKRERSQIRKRKHVFDETAVLSNEFLKHQIHDATSLVCKRKKVPHSYLEAWKAQKFANLHQDFMNPLFPCISSELRALKDKLPTVLPLPKEVQAEQINLPLEISERQLDKVPDLADQERTAVDIQTPGTPDAPMTSKVYESKTKESSSDSELDTMDGEFESHGAHGNEQCESGWSTRTREVAKYLYNSLVGSKEQKQKKPLSLTQILKRSTRTKCARFFYETLTLKSYDCIDVRQESPYGDIILSATPQLEAMFKIP